MTTFLYDGSLEGFLTAVFEAYERREPSYRILKATNFTGDLFGSCITVDTEKERAARVWKGLKKRLTQTGIEYLACASLSELPEADALMLGFIQHVFEVQRNVERDFSNDTVMRIAQVARMVHRERHRMKAFIRFQLTSDGIYYAGIEPDFNVIPLIIKHFRNRYADQRWLIYDIKRKYGVYYDLQSTETVTLDFADGHKHGRDISVSLDEKERFYQRLWQDYFRSVNIAMRKNTRLHLRHVPTRYWKFLTEKAV